ncbi:MAG TPA: ABC transporter substrate-binding protein [Kofleriaceae bacterium]|nr:ABC transporter substrate-binding protein [Kofleriaceae bacterium]
MRVSRPTSWMLAMAIAMALCAAAAAAPAGCVRTRRTPDDTLVVLTEVAVKSADPRYASTSYDSKVSKLVAPGLVVIDRPDLEPTLGLAESLDQVDPTTWVARLRPDVRFSDGTPVTADDVKWTFDTIIAPNSDSLYHKQYEDRLAGIDVVDGRTVRFRLKQPLATFRTDLDLGILAHHAAGADGKFADGKIVAAGPYRIAELSADRTVLVANPYATPAPVMPRVVIEVVLDGSARIMMLGGGTADLVQNAVRYDLIDDVLFRGRVKELRSPSSVLTYMMFNNDDPVLKDVRVRRAIALSLDRAAVIRTKFAGRAVLATGLLPPFHWAYAKDVPLLQQDLAEAGRLLDAAGYPDPDGPGRRPRLHLTYKTSADQFRLAIARVLAAQIERVGIDVEVRPFEFNTFFADVKKGNYQLATMQTSEVIEPDSLYSYFHSSRIPDAANPDVGNRWRYRSPEVDALLEAGRHELDRGKRIAIYGDIQRKLAEDLPVIPLWHEDNVALVNKDVVDYVVQPSARLSSLATARKR